MFPMIQAAFFWGGTATPEPTVSIFLAKVLGIYLMLTALHLFFRGERISEAVKDYEQSPALQLVSSCLALLLGLLVVVGHNVWLMGWPVFVTLIGWFTLCKGVIRLFFPGAETGCARCMAKFPVCHFWSMLWFALGVYLTYMGFSS